MRIPKPLRLTCVFVMSLLMSHLPSVVFADEMIATDVVVGEMSRAQQERRIRDELEREDVRKALADKGLSASEASQRLAALSDQELSQLHKQIEQARYGGDILVTIILILLIIFLWKRI